MATKTITIDNYYLNTIRRSKNDVMDHYTPDFTRKHTLPKYISSIDKEFIYIQPAPQLGGNKDIPIKRTLKFDFSGRDTLSIARTNKEITNSKENRIQLKGINTNDKNIIKTSKYEGISDEDNVFYLLSLKPLNQLNNGEQFQFNLWWLGKSPILNAPIGGGLGIVQKLQNPNVMDNLVVTQGIIKKPKQLEKIELIKVSEDKKKLDNQLLVKKTSLNIIKLKF